MSIETSASPRRHARPKGARAASAALTALLAGSVFVAPGVGSAAEVLDTHPVVLDGNGDIVPWTGEGSDAYDAVLRLGVDYLTTRAPVDDRTGLPTYLLYSYLDPDSQEPVGWPHNPAGLYGMLTEGGLAWYAYNGDRRLAELAETALTYHLDHGMTAPTDVWASVPYASSDGGDPVYDGASFGDETGSGDGTGVIQPDKVAELGVAFLRMWEFTGNPRFRDAAIHAADQLATHIRPGDATRSPWPFRVHAATGQVREEYTANTIAPIELFDRLRDLGLGDTPAYTTARATAWTWLTAYPMRTNIWANYFEDIPIQDDRSNLTQLTALMTARYLLRHPETDPQWESHVRGILAWVEDTFGEPAYGATTIREQQAFPYVMGSHTARYASVNALLHERTGDTQAREKARRSFNWATYMTRSTGVVIDGPDVNNQWWTDGYGDYLRHFLTGMSAVPDWAPTTGSRILHTTSTITTRSSSPDQTSYRTSQPTSTETLKLPYTPRTVTINGTPLPPSTTSSPTPNTWTYHQDTHTIRINHTSGTDVRVSADVTSDSGTVGDDPDVPAGDVPPTEAPATGDCPCTAFGDAVPDIESDPDRSPVNVGMTFTSATDGVISAIRYYKSKDNVGTHVANLWTADGRELARITFTDETASGWQEAALQTPVPVVAGQNYVVSYLAPKGAYSVTENYFATTPGDPASVSAQQPLIPLSGVYGYSDTPAFPTKTFRTSNYFVDVVLETPTTPLPDETPCPCSLFSAADTPETAASADSRSVELGMQFTSDVAGSISAIRFFKGRSNTGTHVASLWSDDGRLLARATVGNESDYGWQEVTLPSPVPVQAGRSYLVSYFAPNGGYAISPHYFVADITRGPLTAPSSGRAIKGNGTYVYTHVPAFPAGSWKSSNYYVDVVFSPVR